MEDTRRPSEETTQLKRGIQRLNAGDTSVRGEILNVACRHLQKLTAQLRGGFAGMVDGPSTEEVFQQASLRLYQALHDTPIRDERHFYQLAAVHIRRELIEVCRFYEGYQAALEDADQDGSRISLAEMRRWAQFHDHVDELPDDEREVFELLWYHELSREEAAEMLGVPTKEVRRLWREARLSLHRMLGDDSLPPIAAGD